LPPVWDRLARIRRLLPMVDIDTLARRLGAQEGFWITGEDLGADPRLENLSGVVTREMVAAASRQRQPALFVQHRSPRPQPRLNIDRSSAIVVPSLDDAGEVSAVAVFVRRSRSPFESRHLDEAMTWMASRARWSSAPEERTALA